MSVIPAHGKIVVYDTEFTSWEGFMEKGFKDIDRYPEIIQLGAITIDVDNDMLELDAFKTLIRPKVNPKLSNYIKNLTHISQNDVDEHGISFGDALNAFLNFVPNDAVAMVCYGRDGQILEINCKLHGLEMPSVLPPEINFKALLLSEALLEKPAFSSLLPGIFGIPYSGAAHNALDDARAIAVVLRELRRQNKI